MARLRQEIANLGREANQAGRNAFNLGEMFTLAFKKLSIWIGASTIFFGFFREIKDGLKFIYDLDNQLNQIRIVTGKTNEEVWKLAESYNQLAKQMGVTTMEIAKMSVELYRQGLGGKELDDRMQGIIKYAKIAGIDVGTSNKIITATMNALGISAERTIDVMSYLGDVSAAGAEEIGIAMQRSASTAEQAGVSYEKLASWITTVSDKTRESASTIGNSMKSIVARYTSIKEQGFNEEDATDVNQVTKALKQAAGIIATDVNGNLRDLSDVMDELGGKWDKLDRKSQDYIATTMAG